MHYWVKWREDEKEVFVHGTPMMTYRSGWHTKDLIAKVKKND
jgi:hypothetical protein